MCVFACFVLFQIRDCTACSNPGGSTPEEGLKISGAGGRGEL